MKPAYKFSDQEILHNINLNKDLDESIGFLYESHYKKLSIFITQNSGTAEDAEDIFQEVVVTFIELVQEKKFRGDSSIGTFLMALNKNMWYNELKRRGRSKIRVEKFESEKITVEEDLSNILVNRELKLQVMDLVSTLGETCKKILVAFYYDNLSMSEILTFLKYENEQVVRNKKYKCLKQLSQTLVSKPALSNNLKSIFIYG